MTDRPVRVSEGCLSPPHAEKPHPLEKVGEIASETERQRESERESEKEKMTRGLTWQHSYSGTISEIT